MESNKVETKSPKPKGRNDAEKRALNDAGDAIRTMKRMATGLLPETARTLTELAKREGCNSDDMWDVLKHFSDKV